MAILVTGGAGYIGSHTVAELLDRGEKVIILDSLKKGHHAAVLAEPFYQGDVRDQDLLKRIFSEHEVDAVLHFAADSLVGESVQDPLKYYDNNVVSAQRLLTAMVEHGVKKIVFSSTAAVYGEPEQVPIEEHSPTRPASPYGETKRVIEKMMEWSEKAYGLEYISLRYFNAAGAHPKGHIGEDHDPETHLIPLVLQVALGKREAISIFGDDYPTPDGTCIRDYIHVTDLAQAHWLAVDHLRRGKGSAIYNLGNGNGYSVKEVIDTARKVTGHAIPAIMVPRRGGDPAVLIASSGKAKRELGWHPQYEKLEEIIRSAWEWHQSHPDGYQDVTVLTKK
ncbi:UDP-glucose 4-epimerase GalE [Paenactinomyces guangxiensis]|uniref:UDP-glucose 4-epimerase n=1 Tax=Paenactinomyces guangxiensis TaxID=1490290 RepID=A0A7W1WQS1_9BACL|nr:UDP-glucose 4-epimerase GalE [Paenactinomyces guangxiensis]MBA4494204.1 UDP-glucose 4-epimerase GalE [Paenactinomyces guangxiensis]MBH8590700.1 UDP-glucose 4-epimerase GalE [Paenactinomyces guangxiensis]